MSCHGGDVGLEVMISGKGLAIGLPWIRTQTYGVQRKSTPKLYAGAQDLKTSKLQGLAVEWILEPKGRVSVANFAQGEGQRGRRPAMYQPLSSTRKRVASDGES